MQVSCMCTLFKGAEFERRHFPTLPPGDTFKFTPISPGPQ